MPLTINGVASQPTREPSCEHPYGGQPLTLGDMPREIYALPLAGYAGQHAPSDADGQKVGNLAMRMRTFDRDHRHWRMNV